MTIMEFCDDENGKITPEQLAEIRKLEMQYKSEAAERGFKYAELEFKNVESVCVTKSATNSYVLSRSRFRCDLHYI